MAQDRGVVDPERGVIEEPITRGSLVVGFVRRRVMPPRPLLFLRASQLGLFDKPRKPVEKPGSRGGHGYYNTKGEWVYGDPPWAGRPMPPPEGEQPITPYSGHVPPPLTLTPTPGAQLGLMPEAGAPTPGKRFRDTLPEKAKSYQNDDPLTALPFEVLEGDYMRVQLLANKKRLARFGTRFKEIDDPDSPIGREARVKLRQMYGKAVRAALAKGKPVPLEVIYQRGWPEFVKAVDARERYEKGYHTSFANRSAAVTEGLVVTHGVKIKRQDGQHMTEYHRRHIAGGLDELTAAAGMGDLSDVWRQMDVTVAHTNGKMPFLRKAGGLFVPSERTVSIGVKGMNALAHELLGHALDAMAGIKLGHSVREETRQGRWSHVNYMSSVDKFGQTNMAKLVREATAYINGEKDVVRLMKAEGANMDPTQLARHKAIKAGLGHYWKRPFEVWARLVEQFTATVRDERRAAETFERPHLGLTEEHPVVFDVAMAAAKKSRDSANDRGFYEGAPGWWTKDQFEKLRPMVQREIRRRITIMRTGKDPDTEAAEQIGKDQLFRKQQASRPQPPRRRFRGRVTL